MQETETDRNRVRETRRNNEKQKEKHRDRKRATVKTTRIQREQYNLFNHTQHKDSQKIRKRWTDKGNMTHSEREQDTSNGKEN